MSLMINIGGLAHKREALRGLYVNIGKIFEESWVYQDIKGKGGVEGRIETLIQTLIRQGTKKFGSQVSSIEAQIRSLTDISQLEQMLDEIISANSWDEIVKS